MLNHYFFLVFNQRDHHNIVLYFLKILKPLLFQIFWDSLREEFFPNEIKIVKVSPIFKGSNKLKTKNYRPISVLPVFPMISEKNMYNPVYNYFVENKLLFPTKFISN